MDLIVWVDATEVTPDLHDRAVTPWRHLAGEPPGDRIYLYAAPVSVLEGYPLSLPDAVNLRRHGAVLAGRLGQLVRAVPDGIGPYGPDAEAAARQLYSLTTGEMPPELLPALQWIQARLTPLRCWPCWLESPQRGLSRSRRR